MLYRIKITNISWITKKSCYNSKYIREKKGDCFMSIGIAATIGMIATVAAIAVICEGIAKEIWWQTGQQVFTVVT